MMEEKELKKLVTKEEFSEYLLRFGYNKVITQINLYYTNEEIKKEKDVSVRVRCVEGKILLQIKEPIYRKGALHIKNEFETEVDCIKYIIGGNELNDLVKKKCYSDVYLIGMLITERFILKKDKYEVAFDRNLYLGKQDYEVEIEYEELPEELVNYFGFGKEETLGKYQRYMQEYLRLSL